MGDGAEEEVGDNVTAASTTVMRPRLSFVLVGYLGATYPPVLCGDLWAALGHG